MSTQLVDCFRSEKYVVTAEVNSRIYKLIQFMFGKKDGSLFVSFPYFEHTEGLVSEVTLTPDMIPPRNVSLLPKGKVTSHLVKYSHHPDGKAHFSQHGKIHTRVRKQSVPINQLQGHVFTVKLQGLASFKELDTKSIPSLETVKRTYLNFNFGNVEPEAVNIVAHWYPQNILLNSLIEGKVGRQMIFDTSDGRSRQCLVCSTIKGSVGQDRVLLIFCEGIPMIDKSGISALTFIGGFDDLTKVNDLSKSTSFLALNYPTGDIEELKRTIGSVDL